VFEGQTSKELINALPKGGYYLGIDIKEYRTKETKAVFENAKGKSVDFVLANSLQHLKTLPAKHFDLVFIDGNHDYTHLIEEFKLVERVIADGGIIAFHDSRHIADVKKVFDYALLFHYEGINLNTPEGRGLGLIQKKLK
jgi:predicted O-methyltransferase YrrM